MLPASSKSQGVGRVLVRWLRGRIARRRSDSAFFARHGMMAAFRIRGHALSRAKVASNRRQATLTTTMKTCILSLGLSIVTAAKAAIVTSTDFEVGPGGAGSTFTPSYAVSDSDLINGLTPSSFGGDFAAVEFSGGLPVLNDGVYGTITEPGGAPDRTHGALGLGGGDAGTGTFVIYALGAHPLGYNISSVFVYGGWNDSGRDQQLYTFSYSLIGDPSFTALTTVNFNPLVGPDLQTANRSILLESALPFLAVGVDEVRFDFPGGVENGYTGYAELDVMGVAAVPEPGAFMLSSVGFLALVRRRRR